MLASQHSKPYRGFPTVSRRSGNVLVLSCLFGILIICVGIFCLSLCTAFVLNNNLQGKVDAIAMEAAASINANDVVGQMNNLISRCRLLVVTSRQSYEATAGGPKRHLQPLAQFLLNQSRDGAMLLENERKNLISTKTSKIAELMQENLNSNSIYSVFPWVQIRQVSVAGVRIGTINDLDSNVIANKDDLYDYDLRQHYISASSHLFRGNLNAKVPNDDRDLHFNISSLPAPAETVVSPAHLVAADRFVSQATIYSYDKNKIDRCDQIPAAVQVECACKAVDLFTGHEYTMPISASACTHGAEPPR